MDNFTRATIFFTLALLVLLVTNFMSVDGLKFRIGLLHIFIYKIDFDKIWGQITLYFFAGT